VRLLSIALFTLPLLAQSPDKEQAIWKALAAEIRKHMEAFNNPAVNAYVNRIGRQLTAHLTGAPSNYSFEVVQAEHATEPIPIPGGHIFIPPAFFIWARNEDEFATMLAHSIGHIELKQMARDLAAQRAQGRIPLIFINSGPLHVQPERIPIAIRTSRVWQTMQPDDELEADKFGIGLASHAGFNPSAFRDYLQRTQRASSSALSALPPLESRLAIIDELLSHTRAAPPSPNEEFLRCQQAVRDALKYL
jgi:beta-barrel assembly-enhancing protease